MNDSQFTQWKTVTFSTLKQFFAIILHMSLVSKPSISDYFSHDPVLYSSFPSAVGMSRNRFQMVLRYLHISDNSKYVPRGQDGHDPLFKVAPIFHYLLAKFKLLYKPRANITVDEAICPFRGRVNFRVYMKNKPEKYGVKVECVCESLTGMVCNMEVYTAYGNNKVDEVVCRLLQPFEGKNHRVFMDRHYSSPSLFKQLLEKGFYPVGTVMSNRKHLPKEFSTTKLKKGEKITRVSNGNILATKWKDKRDVYTLSTIDDDVMVNTTNAKSAYHDHERWKPRSVVTYNKSKAGVDKRDQMASYYPFQRKTLKWWKKVFFWLFQLGLVNAHKLYRLNNPSIDLSLANYMLIVARSLTSLEEHVTTPPSANEPRKNKEGSHFPKRIPPTKGKEKPTRRCRLCSSKTDASENKSRKETSWICQECDVPLCVECFQPYHRPYSRRS